jgi:hypothetical protein
MQDVRIDSPVQGISGEVKSAAFRCRYGKQMVDAKVPGDLSVQVFLPDYEELSWGEMAEFRRINLGTMKKSLREIRLVNYWKLAQYLIDVFISGYRLIFGRQLKERLLHVKPQCWDQIAGDGYHQQQ